MSGNYGGTAKPRLTARIGLREASFDFAVDRLVSKVIDMFHERVLR